MLFFASVVAGLSAIDLFGAGISSVITIYGISKSVKQVKGK